MNNNTTEENLNKTSLGVVSYQEYVYTTTYTQRNIDVVYTLI